MGRYDGEEYEDDWCSSHACLKNRCAWQHRETFEELERRTHPERFQNEMVNLNERQEFLNAADGLAVEYLDHIALTENQVDMTDFAVWILIKQGHERGRSKGYWEGIEAAKSVVNKLIPDMAPDKQEKEEPDNAETISMKKVEL